MGYHNLHIYTMLEIVDAQLNCLKSNKYRVFIFMFGELFATTHW